MSPPSGRQTVLQRGDQRATVVEVGGGLRTYSVGQEDVVDGYAIDEVCPSGRGQPLIPWPNRLAGGRYKFSGESHQAALDEPEAGNAIHGLTRWRSWDASTEGTDRAVLSHRLRPSPGYPYDLDLTLIYSLDALGLTVTTTARNEGSGPCPFAVGFHPYLSAGPGRVDDVVLRSPAGRRYLADDSGIPTATGAIAGTAWDFRAGRAIGDLQLDTGFTDLERDAAGRAAVHLTLPGGRAGVTVWMDRSFTHLMLFTGDSLGDVERRRRGLAVEPMTAAPNAFNSGDGLLVLEPGQVVQSSWGITPS